MNFKHKFDNDIFLGIWEISRNKLKKHSVTKTCSEPSLFEYLDCSSNLILQILGLHARISKVFLDHQNIFFLTVGQSNFGNKIPLLLQFGLIEKECGSLSFTNLYPPKKQTKIAVTKI